MKSARARRLRLAIYRARRDAALIRRDVYEHTVTEGMPEWGTMLGFYARSWDRWDGWRKPLVARIRRRILRRHHGMEGA